MFSVGVFYSVQYFLNKLNENNYRVSQIKESFEQYYVASIDQVINVSLKAEWIKIEGDSYKLTPKGKEIISEKEYDSRLKLQLKHMIKVLKPTWLSLFHKGRREAIRYFPPDVFQCFEEAGLINSYESDVINWWDDLSSISRKSIDDVKLLIGREGEKLSILYEKNRTGFTPEWVSIESNLLGYDILSREHSNNDTPLKIEVKASKSLVSQEFTFYLTRREWDVALSSKNYIFHLWILEDNPKLYVYRLEDLLEHIPKDKGEGAWETVKISIKKAELHKRYILQR